MMVNSSRTINIHTGKKLSGKSREQILESILKLFQDKYEIVAVQQCFDLVRVTFGSEEAAVEALKEKGVRLHGIRCRIDGGPPTTIVHLFDYPHEEDGDAIVSLFESYGLVKGARRQRYISHPDIFTGTRLIDLVMEKAPPRIVSINGFICRVWYRGQPVICNMCGKEGHKSMSCPDKNKCRLCGSGDHLARSCPNPWGNRGDGGPNPPAPVQPVNEANHMETNAAGGDVSPSGGAPLNDHPVENRTDNVDACGSGGASLSGEAPLANLPDGNCDSASHSSESPADSLLALNEPSIADSNEASHPGDAPLSQSITDSGGEPLFSDTPPESDPSDGENSEDISEFTSQESSEQSQSILRDANGSVNGILDANSVISAPVVVIVDEGTVPPSPVVPSEGVESMDSSVSLKRMEVGAEPVFATPVLRSRPRSHSEEPRKKRRSFQDLH